MYHYRLRTNEVKSTLLSIGVEWGGESHLTTWIEGNRIDVVYFADLPKQDEQGNVITTTVDGEEVPVMHGIPHIDILSGQPLELTVVNPIKPLHKFAGE